VDSQRLVDPELQPFLDMFPSMMLSRDNLDMASPASTSADRYHQ
jgi:hypothetical protein